MAFTAAAQARSDPPLSPTAWGGLTQHAWAPFVMSLEHELVAQALDGDGRAFQTLVEPHLGMLYRIALRACSDPSLAEDAVQETLALAHRKLARYQPGTSLKAFLAAIAVRQAQTLLRGERRRRAREQVADAPEPLAGPAEALNRERLAGRIREALAAMPKKRRDAALLRLDGDLSYAEIAASVGTSEGSARVLVHLAMKELREQLADLFPPLSRSSELAERSRT